MSKKNKQPSDLNIFKSFRPYIITTLAIILSYIVIILLFNFDESVIRIIMLSGVFLCAVGCFFKNIRRDKRIIILIITAGIIMRIGYTLYTPFSLRGHDIGTYDNSGHLSYIYTLFSTGTLPDSNATQLYHPPFQHILEALAVKLFSIFQGTSDLNSLFEAAKIVPCFASCAILFVTLRICEETKLSRNATIITLAILAFQPTFYIISADINNDTMMIFLFITSVLYTIRWYYNQSMKNILIVAVSIGLAMMTKFSGIIAALFTGPIFFAALLKKIEEGKQKGILIQFAAFIGVCAPLGLWYPVRNYIKFDQPFGYVHLLSKKSTLYCGKRSIFERFLSFPIENTFNPLYTNTRGDYNIWLFTLKNSVFGEYSFNAPDLFAVSLIAANLIIILISLAAMIYVMVRCKEINNFIRYGMFFIWLIQMGSFIMFNIQYPFGCTMDFRYIVPTAVAGAIYIGAALSHIKDKGTGVSKATFYTACVLVCIFAVTSVLFYAA